MSEVPQSAQTEEDDANAALAAGLVTLAGGYLVSKAWSGWGGARKKRSSQKHLNDAIGLYYSGNADAAVAEIEEALRLDSENAPAHNQIAWWLATSNTNLDKAIAHVQKALQLQPMNVSFLGTLAEAVAWKGDPSGAMTVCGKILELAGPTESYARFYAHFRRAEILRVVAQDFDGALDEYRAAAATRSAALPYDQSNVYFGLGLILEAQDDYAGAGWNYTVAQRLRPDHPTLTAAIDRIKAKMSPGTPIPQVEEIWDHIPREEIPHEAAGTTGSRLFISYSHRDETWFVRLHEHLSPFQRSGLLAVWDDRDIDAGDEWRHEINHHLEQSEIILLLVSSNFIASDYAYQIEMRRALEKHGDNESVVIPVILSDVNWQETPLGELQAVPKAGKPIRSWQNKDAALADAARRIASVAREGQLPAD